MDWLLGSAWLWGAVWLLLSLAGALIFHRMRARSRPVSLPPEVRAFLQRFEEEILTRHPEIRLVGMVPGKFSTVLEVQGQETPVPLHAVFRHWRAYPDAFSRIIERLLAEVEEGGLDGPGDHLFEDVATRILPQLRTREWLGRTSPRFGDSAIAHRPHGPDLAICYVIDTDWSLVFVTQAHLRQWRRTEEDLYHLSLGNLRRLDAEPVTPPAPGQTMVVEHGDGFDAARALLLDPDQVQGLLVAIPERDTLWMARETDQGLDSLMQVQQERFAQSPHPVSSQIYRVQGDSLQPVRTESP